MVAGDVGAPVGFAGDRADAGGAVPGPGHRSLGALEPGAALAGLVCRFLLEFGEVSNAVNFTVPNVLLHLLLAVGVPALTAWQPGTKRGEEGQGHGA